MDKQDRKDLTRIFKMILIAGIGFHIMGLIGQIEIAGILIPIGWLKFA